MTDPASPFELAAAFGALNDYLHDGGERRTALQRLVDLAVAFVPVCDCAAITVWPDGREPRSLASTGDDASAVDQLQYDFGDGPCLTAAAGHETVRIPDLAREDRWPEFAAATLAQTSVRSVLSIHLVEDPDRTALNLYSHRPDSFDADAVSVAALFAAHARVLLTHAVSADKAANLELALTTSRQIGAAVGILMSSLQTSSDEAFELLRLSSRRLNRKLRDIAYEVTRTGALPDPDDRVEPGR